MEVTIKGISLSLKTAPELFSPHQLDRGTEAMLSIVDFQCGDKVLDLGCGYGVVGILAAKLIGAENVVMLDADPLAITVALKNIVCNNVAGIKLIQSDGFANLDDKDFTLILSNPPYHTDFSVAKHFIEKGFNRLALGGRMVMVTKRKEWYKNKLIAIFGGVKIVEINGYYVFVADKRSPLYANAVKKKK